MSGSGEAIVVLSLSLSFFPLLQRISTEYLEQASRVNGFESFGLVVKTPAVFGQKPRPLCESSHKQRGEQLSAQRSFSSPRVGIGINVQTYRSYGHVVGGAKENK